MKKARILSVPEGAEAKYRWKWEDCSAKTSSSQTFEMYFDCLADARRNGYEVELTQAVGLTAPGGAAYRLDKRREGDGQS